MTLRERTAKFLATLISEPNTPAHAWREEVIDRVAEFVISEIGRGADPILAGTAPLILYFGNEKEREEFIAVIKEVKPNMKVRNI